MTTIESNKVEIESSSITVYNFLADLNNFEKLMPIDRIINWESCAEECSFEIKGMTKICMRINETIPNTIKIVSHGKNPFEFTLDVNIIELSADKSSTQMIFIGKINPFVKMMVEKPLTNFFNMLVEKLTEIKFNNER